jgi:hypothetical protein
VVSVCDIAPDISTSCEGLCNTLVDDENGSIFFLFALKAVDHSKGTAQIARPLWTCWTAFYGSTSTEQGMVAGRFNQRSSVDSCDIVYR